MIKENDIVICAGKEFSVFNVRENMLTLKGLSNYPASMVVPSYMVRKVVEEIKKPIEKAISDIKLFYFRFV